MGEAVPLTRFDKLKYGDFICFIFDDMDDYRFIISNFIVDGLLKNEKVLFVNEEYPHNLLIEDLTAKNIDVRSFMETGQLTIANSNYIYINNNRFDIENSINNWRLQLKDLKVKNYSGFRAIGDMLFAASGSQEMISKLMEYESRVHLELEQLYEKQISMCVFNKLRFPNFVLEDMIEKHSVAINGREILSPNPYYLGPIKTFNRNLRRTKLRKQFSLGASKYKIDLIDYKEEKHLETLKDVLRSTGDGVWELDLDTFRLDISESFYKITGYSTDRFMNPHKFLEIINPKDVDGIKRELHKCVEHKTKFFEQETKVLKVNNEWVWLHIKGVPIEVDATNGKVIKLIGTFYNVTNSKMCELELMEKEYYEKMRTDFFANLSHELRTPLAVILGSVQLQEYFIENGLNDLETFKKHFNTVKVNGHRLLRLVNNIIDVTRIESQYLSLELANYPIDTLIREIVLSVEDFANKHNLKLLFDSKIENVTIACDPVKLERIMLNILSNAIKFTREGGNIQVHLDSEDDYIIIKVKDTGVGIPKDKLEDIFNRFIQVDNSLNRKNEGSGIGLSLVKALVKMHDGEITVDSELDKGTEFTIKLPNKKVSYKEGEKIKSSSWSIDEERMNIEFSDIV